VEAGLLYGAVFLAAVLWFVFRSSGFDAERTQLLPYFPVFYVLVVLAGTAMSAYLSDSFVLDPNKWVTRASIALPPLAVLIGACLIAAIGLMVTMLIGLRPLNDGNDVWGVISLTINALSMSMFFIVVSGPVLVLGMSGVTYFLWRRFVQQEQKHQKGVFRD